MGRQSKAAFPLICTILIHEGFLDFLACTNYHVYILVAVWASLLIIILITSVICQKNIQTMIRLCLLLGLGIIVWPKPTKWLLKINENNHYSSVLRSLLPLCAVAPLQTSCCPPRAWSNGSSMETKGYLPIQSSQHSHDHVMSCHVRDVVQNAKTHQLSKEINETRHTCSKKKEDTDWKVSILGMVASEKTKNKAVEGGDVVEHSRKNCWAKLNPQSWWLAQWT